MPTRQGFTVLAVGIATAVLGRLFGVLELFVIGAGLMVVLATAVFVVRFRPITVRVGRRVTPRRVHAGEPARVELIAVNRGQLRTPVLSLRDPVSSTQGATLHVAPLAGGRSARAGYRLPTRRRGLLTVGPLELTRTDMLGLARRRAVAAPASTVIVLPHWFRVAVPGSGRDFGPLGQHLRMRALGREGEEFRTLRDYVPGDDLRRVNWRASARSETFKVRENEIAGLRSLAVVLDQNPAVHSGDSFERAISCAASIVLSATEDGRDVRFATSSGLDLSPSTTGMETLLEHLALAVPDVNGSALSAVEGFGSRLSGGLLIMVGGQISPMAVTALRGAAGADAAVAVATEAPLPGRVPGVFVVDATSEEAFVRGWNNLVGARVTDTPPDQAGVA